MLRKFVGDTTHMVSITHNFLRFFGIYSECGKKHRSSILLFVGLFLDVLHSHFAHHILLVVRTPGNFFRIFRILGIYGVPPRIVPALTFDGLMAKKAPKSAQNAEGEHMGTPCIPPYCIWMLTKGSQRSFLGASDTSHSLPVHFVKQTRGRDPVVLY